MAEQRMSSPTLDRVLDAVLRVDAKLGIHFISEAGRRWFTARPGAVLPRNFLEVLHPEDEAPIRQGVERSQESFSCDVRLLRADTETWVHLRSYPLASTKQHVFCIFDISQWKSEESALRHAAQHDELTGLPNRAYLKRTIEQRVQDEAVPFTVALLDLDGFKKVNDTYGHAMGDAVLVETTRRLRKLKGPDDMLARLGGDEFVMLYADKSIEAVQQALKNVLLAVARPYHTAPHYAYLGVSVGVAQFPQHGGDYSTLLKHADTAMYQSKNAGKNRITVFAQAAGSLDFSIRAAIHQGIQEGEFFMEYQPQFDMDRRLIGAEA